MGRFAVLVVTTVGEPTGSTNSSGPNSDSLRLALQRERLKRRVSRAVSPIMPLRGSCRTMARFITRFCYHVRQPRNGRHASASSKRSSSPCVGTHGSATVHRLVQKGVSSLGRSAGEGSCGACLIMETGGRLRSAESIPRLPDPLPQPAPALPRGTSASASPVLT